MCIRDSFNAVYAGGNVVESGCNAHGRRKYRDAEATQPTLCLLYTSDAADERSSVDLGGRRIIKKKTKYHLAERSRERDVQS